MQISGSCHCGDITYQASIQSDQILICHCSDCQVLSGSAFRTVVMTTVNGLTIIKGQPKEYIKIADSGNSRAQGFCPNCGSSLYATSVGVGDADKIYGIRLGTVFQRDQLAPNKKIWCQSAQPWLSKLGAIPSYSQSPKP